MNFTNSVVTFISKRVKDQPKKFETSRWEAMIFKLPTSVTDVLGSIPTWNSAKLFTCFLIGFQALRHLPFFHIVFLSLSLRGTNSVLFFFY